MAAAVAPGHESLRDQQVTISLPTAFHSGKIALSFTYDKYLVNYVKALPLHLRAWDQEARAWLCPADAVSEVVQHFRQAGVRVNILPADPALISLKLDMVPDLCTADRERHASNIPQETWNRLFPYQRAGVEFGIQRRGRVILADEPGLGKTVQAILIAAAFSENWPLMVVCHSSMRKVWEHHLQEWLPNSMLPACGISTIMSGPDVTKKLEGKLASNAITIASYDLVQKIGERLCREHKFYICDESHNLKTHTANRTRFLAPIVSKAEHAVLISGTPLQAKPIQMFTQIDMVRLGLFGSRDDYGQRYCGGVKTKIAPGVSDYVGVSNIQELNKVLSATVMVRRLKKEVLTDLPDKIRSTIPVAINTASRNELMRTQSEMDAVAKDPTLSDSERSRAKQQLINELYRQTGRAKLPGAIEHIQQLLEAGHKILAFAHHTHVLDALQDGVADARCQSVRIDGSTPPAKRSQLVQQFQSNKETRVALLSITAAGVGLTLTAASVVVFAELTWNPAELVQAEDRAHRVGQDKALQVHYMVATCNHAADEVMWRTLRSKLNIVGKVVDGHLQGSAAGLKMAPSQIPLTPEGNCMTRTPLQDTPPSSQQAWSQGTRKLPQSLSQPSPYTPKSGAMPWVSCSKPALKRKRDLTDHDQIPAARKRLFHPRKEATKEGDEEVIDLSQTYGHVHCSPPSSPKGGNVLENAGGEERHLGRPSENAATKAGEEVVELD